MPSRLALAAALLMFGASALPASATATFRGDLPPGVAAVSPDSSLVLGTHLVSFVEKVYWWKAGVATDVPNNAGFAGAGGASYDGSVFTGWRNNEAFRWENGVATPLGTLGGPIVFDSFGRDISWDGARIVGGGGGSAFIHESGAFTPIGSFSAIAVSGDGEVIAGSRPATGAFTEAVRWEDGVLTGLGDLDGGNLLSRANDVSQDGSVIVGFGSLGPGGSDVIEAVRWDDGVIMGLGHPGDATWSVANAVSADGGVVVGEAMFLNTLGFPETHAAIWDGQGAQWLEDVLEETFGLDLSQYSLDRAVGISADGRTIVGVGSYYPSENEFGQAIGWLVVIPEPATAALVALGLLALAAKHRHS
jgi:uncharacterized membrane protein